MPALMLLCVHCRRLSPRPASDAYRGVDAPPPPCPHCDEPGLVDPHAPDTATMLQTLDDEERIGRLPASTRALTRAGLITTFAVSVAAVALLLVALFFGTGRGQVIHWLLALSVGFIIAVPATTIALRSAARFWARTRPHALPARWALALPAGRDDGVLSTTTVECDAPLVSPLTGRACAAYEVGVRYDDDGAAPLGTWLLLEQEAADLVLPDGPCAGGDVFLRWPREPYTDDPNAARVRSFLAQRGLTTGRETLFLFESVVGLGTSVRVGRSSNAVTVLSPAR